MSNKNVIPLFKSIRLQAGEIHHDLPVTDVLEFFLYTTLITGDRWGSLAAFLNLSTQLEGAEVTVSDELWTAIKEMDRDALARKLPEDFPR
jgi:hypothetical protein